MNTLSSVFSVLLLTHIHSSHTHYSVCFTYHRISVISVLHSAFSFIVEFDSYDLRETLNIQDKLASHGEKNQFSAAY